MNLLTTTLSGLFLLTGANGANNINGGQVALKPFDLSVSSQPVVSYVVSMTAYNAVPEQTDGDPNTTASGARSNPEVVAARSVDLAEELPWGTVIAVRGAPDSNSCGLPLVDTLIGYRVVADSMHPRKRNQIDIMFDTSLTVKVGKRELNPAVATVATIRPMPDLL